MAGGATGRGRGLGCRGPASLAAVRTPQRPLLAVGRWPLRCHHRKLGGAGASRAWPRTFVSGKGLTPFKIGAEYAIIAMMLLPAARFYAQAKQQPPYDAPSLFSATVITILSELAFTLYSDVADVFNLLGHVYKIIA